MLVEGEGRMGRILIDVTRDFAEQGRKVRALDAVLLTHAHRDASGGIGQLREWVRSRGRPALPVYASRETITAITRRLSRLDHCQFVPFRDGDRRRVGGWTVSALRVPHARECPTFAWRLADRGAVVVYASDVARLTPPLERFSRGASVLVIDGAMWKRRLFSHLTIDAALSELCEWEVDRILLTQIGKTCPPHRELASEVAERCARAVPAHDGLTVEL